MTQSLDFGQQLSTICQPLDTHFNEILIRQFNERVSVNLVLVKHRRVLVQHQATQNTIDTLVVVTVTVVSVVVVPTRCVTFI